MPRLRLARLAGASRRLLGPALAAAALALPPDVVHAALASAAGTVFEATPFVLAAALVRSERTRRLAGFLSCGCGSMPGALALPAFALCWLSFGPILALTRLAAAAIVLALLHRANRGIGGRSAGCGPLGTSPSSVAVAGDPLLELTALSAAAFAAAVASQALRAAESAGHVGLSIPGGLLVLAGAAIGMLGPCASAAVASAAGLRGSAVAAAAGLLATAGILPVLRPLRRKVCERPSRPSEVAYALLGLACAWLALRGDGGFVHPRLLPAIAVAAVVCFHLAWRNGRAPRTRAPLIVPLGLLAALVLGSPLPSETIDATNLGDALPGAKVAFSGTAQRRGTHTVLTRFVITCCRADASPLSLVLAHRLPVGDGAWVETSGTIARTADGEMVLAAALWRVTPAPRDAFLYR